MKVTTRPLVMLCAALVIGAPAVHGQAMIGYGLTTGNSASALSGVGNNLGKAIGKAMSGLPTQSTATPTRLGAPAALRTPPPAENLSGPVHVSWVAWGSPEDRVESDQAAGVRQEPETIAANRPVIGWRNADTPEGLHNGMALSEVVDLLGKPTFSVAGDGRDYDQRQYFRLPDGRRVTVSVRQGRVTEISAVQ